LCPARAPGIPQRDTGRSFSPDWIYGNTAQSPSNDLAAHLLAVFPSYCMKNLTAYLHHQLCAVLP